MTAEHDLPLTGSKRRPQRYLSGGRGHPDRTPAGAHGLSVAATAQATGRRMVAADENGLVDLPGVESAVVGGPVGRAPVGRFQPTMTEASAR
jgi:hypothetical protein